MAYVIRVTHNFVSYMHIPLVCLTLESFCVDVESNVRFTAAEMWNVTCRFLGIKRASMIYYK